MAKAAEPDLNLDNYVVMALVAKGELERKSVALAISDVDDERKGVSKETDMKACVIIKGCLTYEDLTRLVEKKRRTR